MNCPQCSNEMIKAKATAYGSEYDYCRTCKKELSEMKSSKYNGTDTPSLYNLGHLSPKPLPLVYGSPIGSSPFAYVPTGSPPAAANPTFKPGDVVELIKALYLHAPSGASSTSILPGKVSIHDVDALGMIALTVAPHHYFPARLFKPVATLPNPQAYKGGPTLTARQNTHGVHHKTGLFQHVVKGDKLTVNQVNILSDTFTSFEYPGYEFFISDFT